MRALLALGFFLILATLQAEDPFAAAAAKREAAKQRAKERAYKTEQPAFAKRETVGQLPAELKRTESQDAPKGRMQGGPDAKILSRVMEAARSFKRKNGTNASDTFTDDPELLKECSQEVKVLYPQLDVPGPWSDRFAELHQWAESQAMPLARDSRRPLLFAHMVALEMTGAMKIDSMGLAKAQPPLPRVNVTTVQKLADGVYMGTNSVGHSVIVQEIAPGHWLPLTQSTTEDFDQVIETAPGVWVKMNSTGQQVIVRTGPGVYISN